MTALTPCAGPGRKSLWVILHRFALDTCRRVYFGMSVSSSYLEAAVSMGAAAREKGDVEVLVNMCPQK